MFKIADVDRLRINEQVQYKEKYIGDSKSKILLLKDFFKDPEYVKDYALSGYFDKPPGANPGFTSAVSVNANEYRAFIQYAAEKFFNYKTTRPAVVRFQAFKSIPEQPPHVDEVDVLAGLCPLNVIEGVESSTNFYRHKNGHEYAINAGCYRYKNLVQTKPEDWDLYHTEYHRFNTFIMYESCLFHTGRMNNYLWKSPEPRLTFNFFVA